MSSEWAALGLAAAAVSVIELDATAAGQFMISRPLVLGPVLGAVFGSPSLGAGFGVLCELFSLEQLPVGGHLPFNATVAAGAGLLLALGQGAAAPELAFPAGLFWGWTHRRLETVLRRRRARLGPVVEERIARGQESGLGGLAERELGRQAAMTFAVLLGALLMRGVLARAWPHAPEALRAGLAASFSLAPWLGMAVLLHAFKVLM